VIDTKPNLNSDKFEQSIADVLKLSGCTEVYGKYIIENGGTISIVDNKGLGKVFTSDANGVGSWQTPIISVSGATNLGTGNGTIYTGLNNNSIQLKTLSGGTNITLTCNGSYIAINASVSGGISGTGTANNLPKFTGTSAIGNSLFSDDGTTPKYNGYKIWNENNDGVGSGLDADTLRGHGTVSTGSNWDGITYIGPDGVMEVGKYLDFHETNAATTDYDSRMYSSSGSIYANGGLLWSAGNDGAGSGLDADKLDGQDGSYYYNPTNSNLPTVPWAASSISVQNGGDLSLQAASGSTDSGDIVFRDGDGTERHRIYDAGIAGTLTYRYLAGTGYKLWHSGNSNLSTVDWAANNLTANNYYKGTQDITSVFDLTTISSYSNSSKGIYATFTAAETITAGSLIYVTTSGTVGIARADTAAKARVVGVNNSTSSVGSGASGSFLLFGGNSYNSVTLTVGAPVYLGTTGLPTTTRPTTAGQYVQSIGTAVSSHNFIFNPSPDVILLK